MQRCSTQQSRQHQRVVGLSKLPRLHRAQYCVSSCPQLSSLTRGGTTPAPTIDRTKFISPFAVDNVDLYDGTVGTVPTRRLATKRGNDVHHLPRRPVDQDPQGWTAGRQAPAQGGRQPLDWQASFVHPPPPHLVRPPPFARGAVEGWRAADGWHAAVGWLAGPRLCS